MNVFREETLSNGLQLEFVDESNRYFGDYHRVCVRVTIICRLADLPVIHPHDEDFRHRAVEAFGAQLNVVKHFERMAVPTADVERIRTSLAADFLQHATPYMSRADYPRALVASELARFRPYRAYV